MVRSGARLRRLLAVFLALATLALGSPAAAQSGGWRDALAATVDDPYTASTTGYKGLLRGSLSSYAQLGDELDAVAQDLSERYVDETRPLDRPGATEIFGHDHDLAVELQTSLNGDQSDRSLVDGLVALLMADRRTAETVVVDAELVSLVHGTEQDEARVSHARRDIEHANESWGRGEPVAAEQHLERAVTGALEVLERNGISYHRGADADGDGLWDLLELRIGADPFKSDSDADGLTDVFESLQGIPYHSPVAADTDGDGTGDGREDVDEDGLDARAEQDAGTEPLDPDTDGEGLSDGAEAGSHGTDPTKPDTDSDGLSDAAEIHAGTDPTNPDSDGDGTPDGGEQHTATVTTPQGVEVTVTGAGDLAGALSVHSLDDDPMFQDAPGMVGDAWDIDLENAGGAQLAEAEITLPYDTSQLEGEASDLRVFWFDEEHGLWRPAGENQEVDTAAHEVSVTVSHFSIYAVFNIKNWNQTWTALGGSCKPRGGTGDIVFLDLALALDSSGSMSWNDPQGLRKSAAKEFVDALAEGDRAAVVDFDSGARVLQALTENMQAVKNAIDRIDDSGGTNIGAGVSTSLNVLAQSQDTTRARVVILLTDGEGFYDHSLSERASREQVTIYTIGLGSSVDAPLLRGIAERTGGQYYPVAAASDLPDVFRNIEEDTGDTGEDTDGDGLTDCQETEGMPDGTGLVFTSDPRLTDTDGDDMPDGVEVGPRVSLGDVGVSGFSAATGYHSVFSDPQTSDTDADGLSDPEEADAGTRARSMETDGDAVGDFEEISIGSNPVDRDTDDDGFDDGYENLFRSDGFDPVFFDDPMSGWEWGGEFAIGVVFGDAWERDSIPWLLGNISSGASSAIPVIGWVTGTIADIRDAVAGLIKGDWVGLGFSAAGLVPYAGDAAAVVGEVGKFVVRNSDKVDEVATAVTKLDDLPASVKSDVLRRVFSESTTYLGGRGFSDAALLRFSQGRMNLDVLADAVRRSSGSGAPTQFFDDWRDGERWLRDTFGALPKGKGFPSPEGGPSNYRVVDAWNPATKIARESKVGYQRWSPSLQRQIDRDADLRDNLDFNDVEWHFFPSGRSGTLGPDGRLVDTLEQAGIPYYIHPPS